MAKYKFTDSYYAKFFADKSNSRFLQTFINTEDLIHLNYGWYLTQGHKAGYATPTGVDGMATFTQKCRKLSAAPLADMIAPLGETNQADTENMEFYSASIPDFAAPGFKETAMERAQKEKLFELFGNDEDIVKTYVTEVQKQIDTLDSTMNLMTAQLQSTGKIDYSSIGRGIRLPLHKAAIPSENFVNAGSKVWTDADCKVLEQMKKIEDKFREKWGYTGALTWKLPRKMFFEVILENAQVKELVRSYKNNPQAWMATTDGQSPTVAAFNLAVQDYEGVSPIEIVTEKARNLTHASDTFVHGWKENVAVLCPAGDAVEFEYKELLYQQLSEAYGTKAISKTWASVRDGLGVLVNSTLNNGEFLEWQTDVRFSAVPALLNFYNHVIVDTTTAGE